ncbi:MAG: transcription elongation factor GreA [Bacteroidetes bacterium]|nr:transcription elongation factor GreA [Bacteroidota bacterium]
MVEITYYTEKGLQKLEDELRHLKLVERPEISRQIADARDKGDLSENVEYDAAKEAQGHLEAKIAKLENVLANARVLENNNLDPSKALILSHVRIKNLASNKEFTYTLVSENEADHKQGKISVKSPIGSALLGKQVGNIVDVHAPAGIVKLEILEISR